MSRTELAIVANATRRLAAAFLKLHNAALTRVAEAAERAEQKAWDHVDKGEREVEAALLAVSELRYQQAARRADAEGMSRRADAVAAAVAEEQAVLPYGVAN